MGAAHFLTRKLNGVSAEMSLNVLSAPSIQILAFILFINTFSYIIADIATSHQVLLFTCQPSSVDALLGASPDARVIELPRHGGRDSSR